MGLTNIWGVAPIPEQKNEESRKVENKQNLKRPVQKLVRFNQEEIAYLENKISESPFNNFQNYARLLLLTGEVKLTDYSELKELNTEVHRIGNNINQIARLANIFEEVSASDVQELVKTVHHLSELVETQLNVEMRGVD